MPNGISASKWVYARSAAIKWSKPAKRDVFGGIAVTNAALTIIEKRYRIEGTAGRVQRKCARIAAWSFGRSGATEKRGGSVVTSAGSNGGGNIIKLIQRMLPQSGNALAADVSSPAVNGAEGNTAAGTVTYGQWRKHTRKSLVSGAVMNFPH